MKELDAVVQLGKHIRQLFCEERRYHELRTVGLASNWGSTYMTHWDGGKKPNGVVRQNIWNKAAHFCNNNNLNPDLLVKAIFYNAVIIPYPSALLGHEALVKYYNYGKSETRLEQKTKIIHNLESEKSKAVTSVAIMTKYQNYSYEDAWRMTLVNNTESFSPLFRFCVAINQGWLDIAGKYDTAAKQQYKRDKELYDEVWQDWIPSELKGGNS